MNQSIAIRNRRFAIASSNTLSIYNWMNDLNEEAEVLVEEDTTQELYFDGKISLHCRIGNAALSQYVKETKIIKSYQTNSINR